METYNKIMQYFWLSMTIILLIVITVMAVREGFNKWAFYYIFAGLTLLVYLMRRFMMKRMVKHQEYLKEQANKNNK